jgi:hypothetical protein
MKNKIRIKIIYLLLKLKRFQPENSILIFSEARGGSTWMMEIINKIPNTIINWEPLHVEKGVVPKDFNWGWRPFIHKDDTNTNFYKLLKDILCYKVYTDWTAHYLKKLTIKEMLKSKIVITKFVRANLLLPYLVNNFNLKYKPIFLVRHPIDVCISQIKAFKIDNNDVENYSINNERFIENKEYIYSLDSKLEKKIAIWCLNNCHVLKDFETLNKVILVFYSDLLINPVEETSKIFKKLNILDGNEIEAVLDLIDFKRPSLTDFKNDLINESKKQLNKNFEKLTINEKDKIQLIFNYFGFNLFNAYSPYPNLDILKNNQTDIK